MRDSEIAWAAGFLDGEGSFSCKSNSRSKKDPSRTYPNFMFHVTQVARSPLERLVDLFGLKIYGPYRQKNRPTTKPFFYYQCRGKRAEHAFLEMVPHMSKEKAEQGWDALLFAWITRLLNSESPIPKGPTPKVVA